MRQDRLTGAHTNHRSLTSGRLPARHRAMNIRSILALPGVLLVFVGTSRADDAGAPAPSQVDGGAPAAFVCAHSHPEIEKKSIDLAEQVLEQSRPIDENAMQTTELNHAAPLPGLLRQAALLVDCNKPPLPPACAHGDNDCAVKRYQDPTRGVVQQASSVVEELRSEADRLDQVIVAEVACRASDKCMGDRMCALVADRRDVYRQIATEKANPAGVVDLVRLHTLGEEAQSVEATIKVMATWYQAARKKPWREACR